MKAMVLAAGLGTRLRPLTENIPKALVKFNGRPLLERLIEKLITEGFNFIVVNIHYYGDKIIEFLNTNKFDNATIIFSDERDKLLDTGGAVKKASKFFDQPFLLHNVDIVSDVNLKELYKIHIGSDSLATLAVSQRDGDNVLVFDENDNLCKWKSYSLGIERPQKECNGEKEFSFSGIHVISPEIFKFFPSEDKFSIIDFYLRVSQRRGKITYYDHTGKLWFDVGTIERLKRAESFF